MYTYNVPDCLHDPISDYKHIMDDKCNSYYVSQNS